jgi:hypothetical protein
LAQTNPDDQLSRFRLLQLLEGIGPVLAKRLIDKLSPTSGR